VTDTNRWPECATRDCDGRIYLTRYPVTGEPRTHCAACEQRGLAPVTQLPPLPAAKEQQ
jgi:hypothetical protein